MATRLNPRIDETTRAKIQTIQLVKRLQDFALGNPDPTSGKPVELDKTRVMAITALLRKTLPDLSSVEMKGDGGGPLVIEIVRFADQPLSEQPK